MPVAVCFERPYVVKDDLENPGVVSRGRFILYSEDGSLDALKSLLFTASWFLSECIQSQISIKRAIAKGPFTADKEKSLYFGQPLIDAYDPGNEVHFYGATLHHSTQADLISLQEGFHFPSKVPLKSGKTTHSVLALETPDQYRMFCPEYEECIRRFYLTSSGPVRKYVDNTLDVYFPGGSTQASN